MFRDWTDDDTNDFIQMNQDPDVMKHFPKHFSEDESINMIERIKGEINEKRFGFFAVEHKETETFIGFIGLHEISFEDYFTPGVEIGWRLKKSYWNQGLATEGAKACLEYAINELKLDKVYSFTAEVNLPSKRVMEKIGMRFDGHFDHPAVSEGSHLNPHVLYVYEQ